MKSFKEIFGQININETTELNEDINKYLEKEFKGDKQYKNLKKMAKKNQDDVPDFLDYVYNAIGDTGIEKLSQKYKLDYDELAKSFLK